MIPNHARLAAVLLPPWHGLSVKRERRSCCHTLGRDRLPSFRLTRKLPLVGGAFNGTISTDRIGSRKAARFGRIIRAHPVDVERLR